LLIFNFILTAKSKKTMVNIFDFGTYATVFTKRLLIPEKISERAEARSD